MLIDTNEVTATELQTELGENWVIARRTKNIIAKYGDDVHCLSSAAYDAAVTRIIARRNYAGVQFTAGEWAEIAEYATRLKVNELRYTLTGKRSLRDLGREQHQQDCRTIAHWTEQLGDAPWKQEKYRGGMNGTGPSVVINIAKRCAARRAAFEQAGLSVYQWPTEEERKALNAATVTE